MVLVNVLVDLVTGCLGAESRGRAEFEHRFYRAKYGTTTSLGYTCCVGSQIHASVSVYSGFSLVTVNQTLDLVCTDY